MKAIYPKIKVGYYHRDQYFVVVWDHENQGMGKYLLKDGQLTTSSVAKYHSKSAREAIAVVKKYYTCRVYNNGLYPGTRFFHDAKRKI